MTEAPQTDRRVRAIVFITLALLLCIFGIIQLASDALYSEAAAPGSFPALIPRDFGLRVYRLLDRLAPAPYVESTLARIALEDGDLNAAQRYAVHLPPSPVRDGLLEQIAAARGEATLAYEYAFAAPDIAGVQSSIDRLGKKDPRRAYALEEAFVQRLSQLQTHPDAVAHGWWMLGTIAAQTPDRSSQELAYRDFVTAAHLAPLDLTNVLGAGNEALTLHDWRNAAVWYRVALNVNPANADAIAGLGLVALNESDDRTIATAQLRRARMLDPRSPLAIELERELRDKP